MATRWTFYDPIEDVTYPLTINANRGGTPVRKKSITQQSTSAPGGKTLVFEGQDEPSTYDISGVLLTEEQYDAFNEWFDKRHQIKVTDDLLREFWIYITSLDMQRVRAQSHPWKHEWSVSAVILDWPT